MHSMPATITVLRARLTLQPRAIRNPDIQPPPSAPASAATNGSHAKAPICCTLKPWTLYRYIGSQVMYSHQTGSAQKRASTIAQPRDGASAPASVAAARPLLAALADQRELFRRDAGMPLGGS